ncbi:hypothetical protein AGMMS49545_20270 [Betaproteobacteria bacterium]|nr:hypothetical protein AGMMS49545_20270 [Betaproteobacteria bacterium]GHU47642.1 hypothetical protein AGMMS50289_23120 [Betaproteobacteria bacterium]
MEYTVWRTDAPPSSRAMDFGRAASKSAPQTDDKPPRQKQGAERRGNSGIRGQVTVIRGGFAAIGHGTPCPYR